MSEAPAAPSLADVVAFWRAAGPKRWFEKDAAFDDDIRRRFLKLHEAASTGKLTDWEANAEGALALLILLDQFPRNMFRGQARMFASDPLAHALSLIHILRLPVVGARADGRLRLVAAAARRCVRSVGAKVH